MSSPAALSNLYSKLDLSEPSDLLIAFHIAENWPNTPPMAEAESLRRLEVIQFFWPRLVGGHDGEMADTETRQEVHSILWKLAGEVNPPRSWLHVFRVAAHRGNISPIAFGAAFRLLVCHSAGNGAPMHAADSLPAREVMLSDLRIASPRGLMNQHEQDFCAALPEQVTLWRGGNSASQNSTFDHARSLHWSPHQDYALSYMRARGAQRMEQAFKKLPTNVEQAVLRKSYNSLALTVYADRLIHGLGKPYLFKAVAPRNLILAYVTQMDDGAGVQFLVDFESLTPDMIEDVTPVEYRSAA